MWPIVCIRGVPDVHGNPVLLAYSVVVEMKDMRQGRLVILGSGETAPTMVEMHRSVLAAAGPGPALILDSSYGFQENVDTITQKAANYFAESVGRVMTPVQWRTRLEGLELDRVLTAIRRARAVYAGPGSPSYTMRVWGDSGFAEAVEVLIAAGGTGTFSSAAAIALGVVATPTHEMYRGGADPYWLPGTNLLGRLTGINAALVPHYDLQPKNGTHDTRRCYIGERRMRQLEVQLPAGAHLIGIDEHTALILHLSEGKAAVFGRGAVTVRVDGNSQVIPAGTEIPISDLNPETPAVTAPTMQEAVEVRDPRHNLDTLPRAAEAAYAAFAQALAARSGQAAAAAVLQLEQTLADACPPANQADEAGSARRALRGMILELASSADQGLSDPRKIVEPLVEALLEQRAAARERRDFGAADAMRDRLAGAGIEVRDSPRGVEWSLQP
jgi:cyanophycinase-like exopeptidase